MTMCLMIFLEISQPSSENTSVVSHMFCHSVDDINHLESWSCDVKFIQGLTSNGNWFVWYIKRIGTLCAFHSLKKNILKEPFVHELLYTDSIVMCPQGQLNKKVYCHYFAVHSLFISSHSIQTAHMNIIL